MAFGQQVGHDPHHLLGVGGDLGQVVGQLDGKSHTLGLDLAPDAEGCRLDQLRHRGPPCHQLEPSRAELGEVEEVLDQGPQASRLLVGGRQKLALLVVCLRCEPLGQQLEAHHDAGEGSTQLVRRGHDEIVLEALGLEQTGQVLEDQDNAQAGPVLGDHRGHGAAVVAGPFTVLVPGEPHLAILHRRLAGRRCGLDCLVDRVVLHQVDDGLALHLVRPGVEYPGRRRVDRGDAETVVDDHHTVADAAKDRFEPFPFFHQATDVDVVETLDLLAHDCDPSRELAQLILGVHPDRDVVVARGETRRGVHHVAQRLGQDVGQKEAQEKTTEDGRPPRTG